MQLHQTDPDGYFLFSFEARENPRPDPEIDGDEWLIPAGCVATAPPVPGEGQWPRLVNGSWTLVAIPSPPTPPAEPTEEEILEAWRNTAELTNIQFAIALTMLGVITADEAEAWVGAGVIPTLAIAALNLIPSTQIRAIARIRFAGARTIARRDAFLPLLAAITDPPMTDEQIDQIFIQGESL
jgi:hypothetical protein